MTTASLPMYDLPELRAAHDALWAALANNLRRAGIRDVPARLSHGQPVMELWQDPDLLISQCCGFDLIARFKDRLRPVATPNFSAPGCFGENYSSAIVVAETCPYSDVRDMAGTIAAINGPESHSGMSALRHLISPRQKQGLFFSEIVISGSHAGSLDLVRRGNADIAAIDSITLALLRGHHPEMMKGLKVLGMTYAAPAPPYVVQASMAEDDVQRVRTALVQTFEAPDLAGYRAQLLLGGLTLCQREDYWVMEAFKDHASKHGLSMV